MAAFVAFFFSALRPRGWTFIDARSLPVLRRRVAQQFGQVPDERLLFRNTNALPNGFDRPVGRLQQLLGREKPLLANIGQHRAARFLAKHLDKPVLRCTQRICDIRWPKLLVEVLADIVSGIQKKVLLRPATGRRTSAQYSSSIWNSVSLPGMLSALHIQM